MTVLLGCISKWQQNTLHVLLDNDYSIRVYQSFVAIFQNISYYAGIMLNVFIDLLCSKLCWHNRLVPTCRYVRTLSYYGCGSLTQLLACIMQKSTAAKWKYNQILNMHYLNFY